MLELGELPEVLGELSEVLGGRAVCQKCWKQELSVTGAEVRS